MAKSGFITLHRQILEWEWYKNINTKVLFLHLLLTANFTEGKFEGHVIQRGQLATSLTSLSEQTGLSVRQVRVSLDHLQMTGEVTSSSYPRFRIITIVKYDEYQKDDKVNDKQLTGKLTSKRQANDKLMTSSVTSERQQYNNDNNDINNGTMEQERGSAKRFAPPSREVIQSFCLENGIRIDVEKFYYYYASKGWLVGKSPMKDWKAAVRGWAKREKEQAPASAPAPAPVKKVIAQDYPQRDYSDIDEMLKDNMRRRIEEMRRHENGG